MEHPDLWGGLIDLDPEASPADVDNLLAAAVHGQLAGEDQIAFRWQQPFVARLQRSAARPAALPVSRIRPDAAYLITGGLGDLGLEVARWLADRGATQLVLLGRTPLPPRSAWPAAVDDRRIAAIQALEGRGVAVTTVAADVSDRQQMLATLADLADSLSPLRGIVHAAGVLEERPLIDTSLEGLHAVLRSKVAGTWVLGQLIGELDLDFFLLFSSMSSLLGWRNVGHYAAANHFLDTFAHSGIAGQTVHSINWGPWRGVGMVSRSQGEEGFARHGYCTAPGRDRTGAA